MIRTGHFAATSAARRGARARRVTALRASGTISGVALETEGVQTGGRKHGTILGDFSRRFVKTNRVPREFGRILNLTQELRYEADYEGMPLANAPVQRAVNEAKRFVATVEALLARSD